MSKWLLGLVLTAVVLSSTAAPVNNGPLCDRQVYVFGSSTIAAEGVREPGANDFASRMNLYFVRVCGDAAKFETVA